MTYKATRTIENHFDSFEKQDQNVKNELLKSLKYKMELMNSGGNYPVWEYLLKNSHLVAAKEVL